MKCQVKTEKCHEKEKWWEKKIRLIRWLYRSWQSILDQDISDGNSMIDKQMSWLTVLWKKEKKEKQARRKRETRQLLLGNLLDLIY
jgi:hypothetical protein